MSESENSDYMASAGALKVWCDSQKNIVNGFNVYYPVLQTSNKVGRLLIESVYVKIHTFFVLRDVFWSYYFVGYCYWQKSV